MKQWFDRAAAILILALLSPVLLAAALLIKLASRGPVLFTQQRVGLGGKPFRIYKFRTMHVRSQVEPDSTVTTQGDARIFPGGNLLRKWKIDELPQLLNVLNGTMSLVGPRPTVSDDYDRMTLQQQQRRRVKPGLTGLAQINGAAGISWPRRIEFDLAYIENHSFVGDLSIMAQTAWLLVTGRADATPLTHDEWTEPAAASTPQSGVWPTIDSAQQAAVVEVLSSGKLNYWTGNQGRQFEAEYAEFTHCKHAIALSNGTAAIELALHAMGIGPGDEVIVPSRTFIATASAVATRGARPVCADVDPDSQNITAATIAPLITERTRALIPVHLAGWPCDMDPILELASKHDLYVIEDCAQAHGAEYKGRPVGSIGHMGAFSFCQDKIITTGGEGGMLVTNDSQLWDKAWRYKDHGKTPDAFFNPQPPSTQFRWLHESFGTNLRMTEMQSAIGRLALQQLPAWIEARRNNAARLRATCQKFACLRTPEPSADLRHSYYKFYTFIRPEHLAEGWDRDRLLLELREAGVASFSGSCSEIYLEEAFPPQWRPAEPLPTARELGETSLMFLVHPTLSEFAVEQMCHAIASVCRRASVSVENSAVKMAA